MDIDIKEIKRLNLIRIMKEHGIDQTRLAELLGRKQPAISRYLSKNNKSEINDSVINKICDVLNIGKHEFIKPIENKSSSHDKTINDRYSKLIEDKNRIIDELGKRIDEQKDRILEQGKRIDDISAIAKEALAQKQAMWNQINSMRNVLDAHHIDLIKHEKKMKKAAETKDIAALGE